MKKINKLTYGPWALITGASSGIGYEFAHQIAACGINVVLVARREQLLKDLGEELKEKWNVSYRVIVADLSHPDAADQVIASTNDLEIGLLVSNAGTGKPGKFLATKLEDIRDLMELNTMSHVKFAHYYGNLMKNRKKGGIILTGAMGASGGLPFMANESGTKSYILSFGKSIHIELKKSGVNVIVLETSPTETPVLEKLGFTKNKLPVKPIQAAKCVKQTLNALARKKMSVIPGFKFWLMDALIPSSFSRKMMGNMLEKSV